MSKPTPPGRMPDEQFSEVLALINGARQRAVQAVNTQLIERSVLNPAKVTPAVRQTHPASLVIPAKAGIHHAPQRIAA